MREMLGYNIQKIRDVSGPGVCKYSTFCEYMWGVLWVEYST